MKIGRDGKIRTCDPMHPMHVRYQAALRPDSKPRIIGHLRMFRHQKSVELTYFAAEHFVKHLIRLLNCHRLSLPAKIVILK